MCSNNARPCPAGWQLPPKRPALGVQMIGDRAYVLIPANASVPAMGRQVFTTVHDNQTDISLLVLEGDFSQVRVWRGGAQGG